MKHETPASIRIQKARTTLLLDHPFFGSLLFRLKGREQRSIPTMATDGVSLYYNPEFVDTLNSATLAGVLAHEVMHPALQHHVRRSGRDPRRWNEACDYAINPLLLDAGLSLPDGVLIDHRFRGMSAEQIYNVRDAEAQPQSGGQNSSYDGAGTGAGEKPEQQGSTDEPTAPETEGSIGQVLDAPQPDEETPSAEEQAREWSVAVNQAVTLSKQAGKTPAGLARTFEGAGEATVDWRELLRRLWSDTIPADSSWMRPNRRHIWNGLYLPGVVREGVGEIAIAIDCSGSVNSRLLRLFEAEVCSILEGQRPQCVHVLYFDTEVHKVETYQAGEQVHLNPVGGGGTDFGPCFDWLEEHGIQPQTLVFLTDLYGSFPESVPRISRTLGLNGQSPCAIRERYPHARGVANARLIETDVLRSIPMNKHFFIFTDGSAIGNPGPAGWAAVVIAGPRRQEIAGSVPWATVSEMELRAAVEALRLTPAGACIELRSDSELLIDGMRFRVSRWQQFGWRNSCGFELQHQELWRELVQLSARRTIRWRWIRGHSGHPIQSRADKLAHQAARTQAGSLPMAAWPNHRPTRNEPFGEPR